MSGNQVSGWRTAEKAKIIGGVDIIKKNAGKTIPKPKKLFKGDCNLAAAIIRTNMKTSRRSRELLKREQYMRNHVSGTLIIAHITK